MKEKILRQAHRFIGILLAIFIILQGVTGVILSIEDLLGRYWGGIIRDLHHGYGHIGSLYRIVIGIGFFWMAISGVMIYMKIKARTKKEVNS